MLPSVCLSPLPSASTKSPSVQHYTPVSTNHLPPAKAGVHIKYSLLPVDAIDRRRWTYSQNTWSQLYKIGLRPMDESALATSASRVFSIKHCSPICFSLYFKHPLYARDRSYFILTLYNYIIRYLTFAIAIITRSITPQQLALPGIILFFLSSYRPRPPKAEYSCFHVYLSLTRLGGIYYGTRTWSRWIRYALGVHIYYYASSPIYFTTQDQRRLYN
jgi:hypothetical protein